MIHFLLSLFVPLCHAAPALTPSTPAVLLARSADDGAQKDAFERLEKEFGKQARAWRKLLREARKSGDEEAERGLAETNPAKSFYPRFEELAQTGSARAALWMATRIGDVTEDKKVLIGKKSELYVQAVAGLAGTTEAKDLLRALKKDDDVLAAPTYEKLLSDFFAQCKDADLQADALYARAKSVRARAQDEAGDREYVALLEEIEKKFPESKAAKYAAGQLYERRHLSVGATAPDFTTEDVDGVEFKLSDYRGKVVLLDFWGFW